MTAAFERVLGRPPTAEERASVRGVPARRRPSGSPNRSRADRRSAAGPAAAVPPAGRRRAQRAREDLVHVLFNHNDFVTIR